MARAGAALVDAARRRHADSSDNSIEVDDNAKVSTGETNPECPEGHPVGWWVAGWLWVEPADVSNLADVEIDE
jgi:hypothetical protein